MITCVNLFLFISSVLLKAHDALGNDISGDKQICEVNTFLKKPLAVRLLDENQKPKAGAPVVFSILYEPQENIVSKKFAQLEFDTVFTDNDGYAINRIRLGGTKGNYYILAKYKEAGVIFSVVALERHYLLFVILFCMGGLALFIFGLNYGSKGLVRSAGYRMRDLLFTFTNKKILALLTGIIVTVILGSSTATSILLVRFASNGLINLMPALGVVLGADIGTTIVIQILTFKILDYALLIVAIGVFARLLFPTLRNISQFIFGFGLLFFSLKIMSGAVGNLRYLPGFDEFINSLSSFPLLGLLLGAILAFLFHSSAAVIGILLVLGFESLIPLSSALPIVLGANLGTTLSTFLASDTTDGRRVAFGNFLFKLLSIIIFLPLLNYVINFLRIIGGDTTRQIANFHTLFNICTAVIFLPLLDFVEKFLKQTITETKGEILRKKRLDPTFLSTPAIALGQAMKEILLMADITIKMLEDVIKVFENKDMVLRKKIIQTDDEIDAVEEMITPYLSQIGHDETDTATLRMQQSLLSIVTELEHIGDIVSKNLMAYAKKEIDFGLTFSPEGMSEIKDFHNFVLTTLRMAVNSVATQDKRLAREVVERRETGLQNAKRYEANHILRLSKGLKESLETSTIHLDIISDLERINFHAVEIGRVII